ncbi:MAG: HAMP domain-containing sensor histidine kinase [Planctomycetota bacterium]|nr:HAMP domain-containing sensor histidine kinase [Planctomycetota bacterium]
MTSGLDAGGDGQGPRRPGAEDPPSTPPREARPAARQPPGEATAILTRAVADRLRMRPNFRPRQGSRRVALALYVLLLVLPTVVLGGLLWNQLDRDHEALLASVPGDASHATRRLQEALVQRIEEVVRREDERPFLEFRPAYFPPGTIGAELAFVPSPLADGPTPSPILAWFSYRGEDASPDEPLHLLLGSRAREPVAPKLIQGLRAATLDLRKQIEQENFMFRILRVGVPRQEHYAVPVIAINLSDEDDIDCLREELPALRELQNQSQAVTISPFRLRFWREKDDTPRLAATRTVWIPPDPERRGLPSCFANLGRGVVLRQGFFLDTDWAFRVLPASIAETVLGSTQRFIPSGTGRPERDSDVFSIQPLKALAVDAPREESENFGVMRIAVDVRHLESVFRTQTIRLLGVGAMLVVSLATGLVLLLRSVTRELESARRTENFVSAITHELRTPVAAIKLYGEMLDAGWVDSDERRLEYYRRIVRETSRLETLVERVLEKGQLTRHEVRPEPGDLNSVIEGLAPSLLSLAPEGVADLRFDLQDGLPEVLLVHEGVRSIVTNLVENARKYAPVAAGGEPILVRTRRDGGSILLEVLDRGPGIPPAERGRVFEAFYRMGDERTRTARGTGLGLHLVALHVDAMGGTVEVRGRQGGGTEFRIALKLAPNG